jgi:hypothetical protein
LTRFELPLDVEGDRSRWSLPKLLMRRVQIATKESNAMKQIKDRIKELRRVPAGRLRPNPKNWRTHPDEQRLALAGILEEVGYADALLAREMADGTLMLIDGHLRAETTPDALVPVLVLDLDDSEADKLLAVLDPLAALAGADSARLDALLCEIKTENDALARLLEQSGSSSATAAAAESTTPAEVIPAPAGPAQFGILIDCQDEQQQIQLLERFSAEGLTCRAFVT